MRSQRVCIFQQKLVIRTEPETSQSNVVVCEFVLGIHLQHKLTHVSTRSHMMSYKGSPGIDSLRKMKEGFELGRIQVPHLGTF